MKIGLGVAIVVFSALAMFSPARAQVTFDMPGIHIGPGEHHHRYGEHELYCQRLIYHCRHKEELGEEGNGNCARYREECE